MILELTVRGGALRQGVMKRDHRRAEQRRAVGRAPWQ